MWYQAVLWWSYVGVFNALANGWLKQDQIFKLCNTYGPKLLFIEINMSMLFII